MSGWRGVCCRQFVCVMCVFVCVMHVWCVCHVCVTCMCGVCVMCV